MRISATGKPSQTEVSLIKVSSSAQGQTQSLLLVNLLTGRKHQIRVHLSSLGFPLVGDALYGSVSSLQRGAKKKHKAQQLMLHAYHVGFIHPVTGAKIVIKRIFQSDFLILVSLRWTNSTYFVVETCIHFVQIRYPDVHKVNEEGEKCLAQCEVSIPT